MSAECAAPTTVDTTGGSTPTRRRPEALGLMLTAMICVQTGLALSLPLVDEIGVAPTVALRLVWASLILLVVVRPRVRGLGAPAWRAAILSGLVTGVMTLTFLAAVSRLDLGVAVSIEFLGPLGVCVARSWRRPIMIFWAVVALAGVVLMARPWQAADVDAIGLGIALASGGLWAAYILVTARVGSLLPGTSGLALSMPVSALVALAAAAPAVPGLVALPTARIGHVLLLTFAIAWILPVVPFAAELRALRLVPQQLFGVWAAAEPVIGVLTGLVLLHQVPAAEQGVGVVLVVAAGVAVARG